MSAAHIRTHTDVERQTDLPSIWYAPTGYLALGTLRCHCRWRRCVSLFRLVDSEHGADDYVHRIQVSEQLQVTKMGINMFINANM